MHAWAIHNTAEQGSMFIGNGDFWKPAAPTATQSTMELFHGG